MLPEDTQYIHFLSFRLHLIMMVSVFCYDADEIIKRDREFIEYGRGIPGSANERIEFLVIY